MAAVVKGCEECADVIAGGSQNSKQGSQTPVLGIYRSSSHLHFQGCGHSTALILLQSFFQAVDEFSLSGP
jgi:hypothetical protein